VLLSSPPTYPHTHPFNYLPTCPYTFLPTNLFNKYLLDATYKVAPTYLVGIQIDLAIAKKMRIKKRYYTKLGLVDLNKI
jgi:hypothetical protein